MELLGIQIGKAEPTPAKTGMTGHFKTPTDFAQIEEHGVVGDVICDLANHGGVDQAVYIFGEPDRIWWANHLERDTPPGFFGENLLISDLCTADLVIGDILTVGAVMLQITSPRIPCETYATHIGSGQAIKQFYKAARPGAYARVLRTGSVKIGAQVTLTAYDGDRITLVENMTEYLSNFVDEKFLSRVLQVPAHYKLHDLARQRLGKT